MINCYFTFERYFLQLLLEVVSSSNYWFSKFLCDQMSIFWNLSKQALSRIPGQLQLLCQAFLDFHSSGTSRPKRKVCSLVSLLLDFHSELAQIKILVRTISLFLLSHLCSFHATVSFLNSWISLSQDLKSLSSYRKG